MAHKFLKLLKFDHCVNVIYLVTEQESIIGNKESQKVPAVDKCSAVKTPMVSFANTLGPRRIPLGCIPRTKNGEWRLTLMGYLL